jgi:hypothetical protein
MKAELVESPAASTTRGNECFYLPILARATNRNKNLNKAFFQLELFYFHVRLYPRPREFILLLLPLE